MRVHGPWQMAATGLPASNIAIRKSTAGSVGAEVVGVGHAARQDDGVVVGGAGPLGELVDREAVGPVQVAHRLDHPGLGAISSAVPPASTTARQGPTSSLSSVPSLATTKATRTSCSSFPTVTAFLDPFGDARAVRTVLPSLWAGHTPLARGETPQPFCDP